MSGPTLSENMYSRARKILDEDSVSAALLRYGAGKIDELEKQVRNLTDVLNTTVQSTAELRKALAKQTDEILGLRKKPDTFFEYEKKVKELQDKVECLKCELETERKVRNSLTAAVNNAGDAIVKLREREAVQEAQPPALDKIAQQLERIADRMEGQALPGLTLETPATSMRGGRSGLEGQRAPYPGCPRGVCPFPDACRKALACCYAVGTKRCERPGGCYDRYGCISNDRCIYVELVNKGQGKCQT
jgi:hypothetical protein